jgi:hypothetical protein
MDDHSFPGHDDFPDHDPSDPHDSFDEHGSFDGAHEDQDHPGWAEPEEPSGSDTGHDAAWSADHDHAASDADAPDLYSDGDAGHHDLNHVDDADHAEPSAHDEPEPHEPVPADHEPPLGADPDLPPADDSTHEWLDLPDLGHVDVPEPVGGAPWVDTGLLGAHDASASDDVIAAHPAGAVDDLRAALGEPAGDNAPGHESLLTSDDPAVRALAHLWGPPA